MKAFMVNGSYGPSSKNRLYSCTDPTITGAKNCLETFYFSFHNKEIFVLGDIWYPNENTQLNNPVGGIVRGVSSIVNLYKKIFSGDVNVQVEFTNLVAYASENTIVFAGEEIGSYSKGSQKIPLRIRTSRAFSFSEEHGRWYQFHHHGSIDDAIHLAAYQKVIFQKV